MANVVTVSEKSGGGWQLLFNGAPYYVKGAGGTGELEKAVDLGANSIRTWSTKEIDDVLEKAKALGLTVCVGLWLKHASSNPDFFKSSKFEADRKKTINEFVSVAHENHPSVLMWMIGNEANAEGYNDFAPLYQFIQEAAVAIKAADPNHPVGTVTTSPTEAIASNLNKHAPAIDIWGVNAYGSMLERLPAKMREIGFKRAYCVTEYGPTNWWQVKATDWGARLEPHSTAKALTYRAATETMIGNSAGPGAQCIGGYAFKWGWKTQVTVTWVNLFNGFKFATAKAGAEGLTGGETTEAVDEISRSWTGAYPANRATRIDAAITLNGAEGADSVVVTPGSACRVTVGASDPDGDALRFAWMVLPEVGKLNEAAREGFVPDTPNPEPIQECAATLEGDGSSATFRAPTSVGYYRVYVFVSDGHGHIATDNCPFMVSAKAPIEVSVSADTYVRDGEYARTVFGKEATLATKRAGLDKAGKGVSRVALLRFDVPRGIPAWSKCELRAYALDGDKGSRAVNAHAVDQADAGWDESAVCAAFCPRVAAEPLAAAAVASPFGWMKWNVTSHVRAALSGGGGTVSLALINGEKTEKAHSWAAKDGGGAEKAARLVFTPE